MNRREFVRLVVPLGMGALLAGCNHYGLGPGKSYRKVKLKGGGPPPHAPAHGYRHKYSGADLVFDTGIGVYLVAGLANHFYDGGRFFRLVDGYWQIAVALGGPWSRASAGALPPGLRKKAGGGPPGHRGKGKGKSKGRK